MEKVSAALCIPTSERSDMVEEFLVESSGYYLEAGMDIYFYDGSGDTKTEEIVHKYQEGRRIFYIKRPAEYNIYMILQGFGFQREYDFICLFGDAVRYTKEAVETIVSNLKLEYDMVCIDGSGLSKTGTRTFSEPREFMRECAWRVDYLGATFINWHTMLKDVDWNYYDEKYRKMQSNVLHHSVLYWTRARELSHFCALNLALEKGQEDWSPLKKSSVWYQYYFFRLWCEIWVETIECLPGYSEEDKQNAILKMGELCYMKNAKQFLVYRRQGFYSFRSVMKYWHVWKKVTCVPRWKLCLLSWAPRPCLDAVKVPMKTRLERFCRSHGRVIIYGAAFWGKAYAEYFEQRGIAYDGFCSTKRKPGKYEFCGRPIYIFDEIKQELDENIGIVVAIEHAQDVIAMLQREMNQRHFFYDLDLGKELRYQLGYQNGIL